MHSFDNGTGLTVKRDNWGQLTRFFAKRGIQPGGRDVTKEDVESIVNCKPETTEWFIHSIYEFLTGKK